MNNNGPFINPLPGFMNNEPKNNILKLIDKLDRLEKSIRILENRINKLENRETKPIIQDEPTDMYMI